MTPPPHSVFGLEFGFWGGKPRGTRKTGPGDRIRGPDPGPGARGARDPENRVFGPKIGPKTGPGPGPGTRFWDRFWTGLGPVLGPKIGSKTGPKTGPKRVRKRVRKVPRDGSHVKREIPKNPNFVEFPDLVVSWFPAKPDEKNHFFRPFPPRPVFSKTVYGGGDALWAYPHGARIQHPSLIAPRVVAPGYSISHPQMVEDANVLRTLCHFVYLCDGMGQIGLSNRQR